MTAALALPTSAYLRLERVSEITGDPVSTLREAIALGELRGIKRGKSYYTSLEWHGEWIENAGRGDDTDKIRREVPRKDPDRREGDIRPNRRAKERSAPSPVEEAPAAGRGGRKRGRRAPIVYLLPQTHNSDHGKAESDDR